MNQLEELLEKKFVDLEYRRRGVHVLLVKEKDGTKRLCMDYR